MGSIAKTSCAIAGKLRVIEGGGDHKPNVGAGTQHLDQRQMASSKAVRTVEDQPKPLPA